MLTHTNDIRAHLKQETIELTLTNFLEHVNTCELKIDRDHWIGLLGTAT